MTDVLNGTAPAPASESNPEAAQINAATTDPQTDGGEGGESESGTQKTFTQQELDDIVKKRVAKAEDRAERRVLRTLEKLQPQQTAQPRQQAERDDGKPKREQFASEDDWLDARDSWRDNQRAAKEQHEKQLKVTQKVWKEAMATPGFDAEAFTEITESLPANQARGLVEAVLELDESAKVLAHLSSNPDEAQRIAGLSAFKRGAELGKLEARLEAEKATPPARSKAPAALSSAKGSSITGVRSEVDLSQMTDAEYGEYRAQQRRNRK